MSHLVVLIHTVPLLVDTFTRLGNQLIPDVQLVHIVDEVLLKRVNQNGGTDENDVAWLRMQVGRAVEIQADAVLVTCTILSDCVEDIRPEFSIPIIKIDEMMAEQAVKLGDRIGIIVTNPDTAEPSSKMILDYAAKIGKPITITQRIVAHAFDAVRNGFPETHDLLVKQAILELAPQVDVIILAQASMARVLDILPEVERIVPVLSSPHLAFERLRIALEQSTLRVAISS